MNDFKIDLSQLKSRPAVQKPAEVETRIEEVAEKHGFIAREPQKRRGRKPSPRTGQVHAKVLPHVSTEISNEAKRRGVQQGVLIEEAWALYVEENGL